MPSNAGAATVALANGAGLFLCVAGNPHYIAASVPLQLMPYEKLASHTYSKDHRSPWLIQTAYIPHACVYICKTVNRVCTYTDKSSRNFEARSVIFNFLELMMLYVCYSVIGGVWEDFHAGVLPQQQWQQELKLLPAASGCTCI